VSASSCRRQSRRAKERDAVGLRGADIGRASAARQKERRKRRRCAQKKGATAEHLIGERAHPRRIRSMWATTRIEHRAAVRNACCDSVCSRGIRRRSVAPGRRLVSFTFLGYRQDWRFAKIFTDGYEGTNAQPGDATYGTLLDKAATPGVDFSAYAWPNVDKQNVKQRAPNTGRTSTRRGMRDPCFE